MTSKYVKNLIGASVVGVLFPVGAQAAKDCRSYVATIVHGSSIIATFSAPTRTVVPAAEIPSGSRLLLRGEFNEFDVNLDTLSVHDYTLTGSPGPNQITNERTRIFASRAPDAGVLDGDLDLRVEAPTTVITRAGVGGEVTIQAKDCDQGSIFDMSPALTTNAVHTLNADPATAAGTGTGYFYCFQKSLTPGLVTIAGTAQQVPADHAGPRFFTNGVVLGFDSPVPSPDDPELQCPPGRPDAPECTVELTSLPQDTPERDTSAQWRIFGTGGVGLALGGDALDELVLRGGEAFCPNQTPVEPPEAP